MKIVFNQSSRSAIAQWLTACPDADREGDGFIVDLYESEPPLSLEIAVTDEGIEVYAAVILHYDETMDGWYAGEKIKNAQLLAKIITENCLHR